MSLNLYKLFLLSSYIQSQRALTDIYNFYNGSEKLKYMHTYAEPIFLNRKIIY